MSRYQKVRALTNHGLGQPYILDRKHYRLCPYKCDQWWKSKDGLWFPTYSGGIGTGGRFGYPRTFLGVRLGLSPSTFGLNVPYVAGTSGGAVGVRFQAHASVNLTDIYYFSDSITGTPDVNWELRPDNGLLTLPDTSVLTGSGSHTPSTTGNEWKHISGLSTSITAASYYWLILADIDAGGSFANIYRTMSSNTSGDPPDYVDWFSAVTTNGWTTKTTDFGVSNIVAVFSDGSVRGCPFSANPSPTLTTNQKGLFIDGLIGPLRVSAMVIFDTLLNGADFRIWSGNNGPSGVPMFTSDFALYSGTGAILGFGFNDAKELSVGSAYRLVCSYSGNSTRPNKLAIGAGSDANLRKAMLGSGHWGWAESNSTIDWSNDDMNSFPNMVLYIDDPTTGNPISTSGPVVAFTG